MDLEFDLERGELVALLDQALAVLPVETARILVQRYVDGLSQAEVAARFGVSEMWSLFVCIGANWPCDGYSRAM